jgi:hypothetical protein
MLFESDREATMTKQITLLVMMMPVARRLWPWQQWRCRRANGKKTGGKDRYLSASQIAEEEKLLQVSRRERF